MAVQGVGEDAGAGVPDVDEVVEARAQEHLALLAVGQGGHCLAVAQEHVGPLELHEVEEPDRGVHRGRRQRLQGPEPDHALHRGRVARAELEGLLRPQRRLGVPDDQGRGNAPALDGLRGLVVEACLGGIQHLDLMAPAELPDHVLRLALLHELEGLVPEAEGAVVARGDHPLEGARQVRGGEELVGVAVDAPLPRHGARPVQVEARLALLEDHGRLQGVLGPVKGPIEVALGGLGPVRHRDLRGPEVKTLARELLGLQPKLLGNSADKLDKLHPGSAARAVHVHALEEKLHGQVHRELALLGGQVCC
mmetsp:Transcript_75900/g.214781  ORF Transcript_75900/g.214781 Transcript_75900/m.214781 type:complete len:308 (-) Transcript_75900:308-1231(-)